MSFKGTNITPNKALQSKAKAASVVNPDIELLNKLVTATQNSKTRKVQWLMATLFYRYRDFSNEDIKTIIAAIEPKQANVVSAKLEGPQLLKNCMAELQQDILVAHEALGRAWLGSEEGLVYQEGYKRKQKQQKRRPLPEVSVLEGYFALKGVDLMGVWVCLARVANSGIWDVGVNSSGRGIYMSLRNTTYNLLRRFIAGLSGLTGEERDIIPTKRITMLREATEENP
ncbi:hypothetical protein BDZ91DRAFT_804311 [Kalaharituber pfeilii]|nr:hypothetical protein BDZ91DRAFT_804311 [Kalaharituber pfeilii]